MTYPSPSAAMRDDACPACLGDGETFHIVEDRLGPCSACGGTGELDDWLAQGCDDPDCPDHGADQL